MIKLFVTVLTVVATIVAWIYLRRRRALQIYQPLLAEKPSTEELPISVPHSSSVNNDCEAIALCTSVEDIPIQALHLQQPHLESTLASQFTEVQTESVAKNSPQLNIETTSTLVTIQTLVEPVRIVPSSFPLEPDITFNEAVETTAIENVATKAEQEEVQTSPTTQMLAVTDDTYEVKNTDFSHQETFVMDAQVPASLSEITNFAIESNVPSDKVDEDILEPSEANNTPVTTPTPIALQTDETEPDRLQLPEPFATETEPIFQPPSYHPPTPPKPMPSTSTTRERTPRSNSKPCADLRLRLQLVFGRGGTVKTLALVPDRRAGMPGEIELKGTQGELYLTELRDNCYEPIPLPDAANALRKGVEWRGRGAAHHWRWVMSGRELYVFVPGEESGLHGFVSTARLWLNDHNVVLSTANLREDVMNALANVGCVNPEVIDDQTPGVPTGWILFRDVTPTRTVPMRDDQDILNALCPSHDIEPHFVGGIRLERNTWLAGFPPRIRLTGELESCFQVMIDGLPAQTAADGALEVPGWDSEGEHRLLFGDRYETYSLYTMSENWDSWHAYDFGTRVAICGAGLHQIERKDTRQVRVPASNPVLIGGRPGEIYCCQAHHDLLSEIIFARVPFLPVWALPIDTLHSDKRSTRIILLNAAPPIAAIDHVKRNRDEMRSLNKWIAAINDARHKQLELAEGNKKDLWRQYCVVAKHLCRRMR